MTAAPWDSSTGPETTPAPWQTRAIRSTEPGPAPAETIVPLFAARPAPKARLRSVPAPTASRGAAAPTPPATSAAWRPGDPVGDRRFARLGPADLEAGGRLPERTLAYETWGTLSRRRDNAILVLHALTGDSHATGPAGPGHPTPGWWTELIGPGRPIDTDRYFVVAPNVLGGCQGSTGPASRAPDGAAWGSRFPYLTVRDQVHAEIDLADHLGVDRWALVIGGSMGGLRVLEWAALAPTRVGAIAPIATCARTSADQIAWAQAQLAAIRADPAWSGGDYHAAPGGAGPTVGLGIARQIAHATYRSAGELESRFGRDAQGAERPLGGGGRYAVQSYLEHHGDKLTRRFDAGSYVVLTEALCSHDLGRDRGGAEAALAAIDVPALVLAVDTDRLYPVEDALFLDAHLPGSAGVRLIHSDHGHDGFLIESEQVGAHVRRFLEELRPGARR